MVKKELFFNKHKAEHGSHMKFYKEDSANKLTFTRVSEIFMTTDERGVLSGLHRQTREQGQQRIIKVVNGRYNVRVVYPKDLPVSIYSNHSSAIKRTEYGDTVVYFDDRSTNTAPILVPEGALLGYVSLEDNSKMLHMVDTSFDINARQSYNAFDKRFDIEWGFSGDEMIISDRDDKSINFND